LGVDLIPRIGDPLGTEVGLHGVVDSLDEAKASFRKRVEEVGPFDAHAMMRKRAPIHLVERPDVCYPLSCTRLART
jgi:hypothetical protein